MPSNSETHRQTRVPVLTSTWFCSHGLWQVDLWTKKPHKHTEEGRGISIVTCKKRMTVYLENPWGTIWTDENAQVGGWLCNIHK